MWTNITIVLIVATTAIIVHFIFFIHDHRYKKNLRRKIRNEETPGIVYVAMAAYGTHLKRIDEKLNKSEPVTFEDIRKLQSMNEEFEKHMDEFRTFVDENAGFLTSMPQYYRLYEKGQSFVKSKRWSDKND